MGPITQELYKQIKGWRIYSVIAPAVFSAGSGILFVYCGTQWQDIFYTGLIILGVSCISWWHWSLSTMMTMLGIMKDTDDHFEKVAKELEHLRKTVSGKPSLKIVSNNVDTDK